MGLELELSEMAVIRSIRTAVTGVDGVTLTRPAGSAEGEDAADTGCVTLTAAAVSTNKPPPQSGVVVDDVDAGCVTPKAVAVSPLQGEDVDDDSNTGCVTPAATIPTTPPRRGAVLLLDDANFVTPISAASVLRPPTECPPAPRKTVRSPVAAKRKHCGGGQAPQRCFFPVPRDLTKVFVARGPVSSSPPQAAKKIRVHPVG